MDFLRGDGNDPYDHDDAPPEARKKRRNQLKILALGVSVLISTTVAANITLSNNRIEFGSGVYQVRVCDQWVQVTLNSTLAIYSGTSRVSSMDINGLNPVACKGSFFTLRLYGNDLNTPLDLFEIASTTGISNVSKVDFKIRTTVSTPFADQSAYNTYANTAVQLISSVSGNVASSDSFHNVCYTNSTGVYRITFSTPLAPVPAVTSITIESNSARPDVADAKTYTQPGLAGKFFNGDWRSVISTGNIGTLPLTTSNDSSNVTGSTGMPSAAHRNGVNLWPYITYSGNPGEAYGFIAVGYFTPPTTGSYTFYTSSDDGSGVWVGDNALPGATRNAGNATLNNNMGGAQGNTPRSAAISLTANVVYPIRIVHEEVNGGDNLTFTWSGPSIAETSTLTTYFTTPSNSDGTLIGNYRSATPVIAVNRDGVTAARASTSAYQIKQDFPSSPSGLYWIKSPYINGGAAFQIYADMTTAGGGWTLVVANNSNTGSNSWTTTNLMLRDQLSPPVNPETTTILAYSILQWADSIKKCNSGFQYRLDAASFGRWGGVFTANQPYSFVSSLNTNVDVTLNTKFDTWVSDNNGIENRMPWFSSGGSGLLTTSESSSSEWWGTIVTKSSETYKPAPWLSPENEQPQKIWYWVR